jgi:hypothetical protein
MNIVLYTHDFEPITVVDLPLWLLETLERDGAVKVAVKRPITPDFIEKVAVGSIEGPETVTIEVKKLRWYDGSIKAIYVTKDEVLSLVLKPEWLPGQLMQVQNFQGAIGWLSQQLKHQLRKNNLDGNA